MTAPSHLASALFACACIFVGFTGCGPEPTSCASSDDCFRGEACIDGECGTPPDGWVNNGAENNGVVIDTAQNNGNNGNNGVNPLPTGACLVDPFTATCDMPDDNDSFSDYLKMEGDCGEENCGLPGCSAGWDKFVSGELLVESLQLCAAEERDRYSTNLIPCDNKSFVVQATLTPRDQCPVENYSFDMGIQGYDCTNTADAADQTERVRCEELDDGSKRVTTIVAPSNSIAVANFRIEELDKSNVQFEYDLHILVRE